MIQFWWRSGSRFGSGSPKSEIRILRIGGGLCSLSISSLCLFSDTALAACNVNSFYGVYLWSAGHVPHDSSNPRSWKSHSVLRDGSGVNYWIHNHMNFTYWNQGQPDNSGGHENCVNIWPNHNYEWNDEECNKQYCFVCENRNIDT